MDCIELAVGILADALEVPVKTEHPRERPQTFVLVALVGDYSDDFLLRPRIGITVWGETDRAAHTLAMSCVDALRDASLDHATMIPLHFILPACEEAGVHPKVVRMGLSGLSPALRHGTGRERQDQGEHQGDIFDETHDFLRNLKSNFGFIL